MPNAHTRIYVRDERSRVKKIAVTKKNILLTAIAFLTVAVLTLSIVLPLTLTKTVPTTQNPLPETGGEAVLPSTPTDSVTSDSAVKYSAGSSVFADRVAETGSVETGYTPTQSYTAISSGTDFITNRNAGNSRLTQDIELADVGSSLFATENIGNHTTNTTFDGAGHTITISGTYDYTMTGTIATFKSGVYATGIFAKANWGTIKNVKVVIKSGTTINVTTAGTVAGAFGIITGWNAGTIENVSVTIEDGATVKLTSAIDCAIGGVAGISAKGTSDGVTSVAVMENVKIINNGVLSASNSVATHVGVGGVVGRLEEGTYSNIHVDGGGVFKIEGSTGWRFAGGFAGFDRASGGGGWDATSETPVFNNFIYTHTGYFEASATSGENYVGRITGLSTGRTYSFTLYSPNAAYSTITGNFTSGVSSSTTVNLTGNADSAASISCTHRQVTATDARLGYLYSATSGSVFTESDWDGVVAVYDGTATNISTTEIASATNAEIVSSYGYVAIKKAGNASFAWVSVTNSAYWPTNATIATVGDVPIGYQPDTSTPAVATAISTVAEFSAMSLSGSYYLTQDVTITSLAQLAHYAKEFSGYFDGNGHTITISIPTAETLTPGSVVADFMSGYNAPAVGGLFAKNSGTIRNLKVIYNSSLSATRSGNLVGGVLVGGNTGTITNVSVTMTDTSSFGIKANSTSGPYAFVGGIAGVNNGTMLYTEAVLNGTLSGTNTTTGSTASTYEAVGGLVGSAHGGSITLSRVLGTPSITADSYYFGGVIGRVQSATTITNVLTDVNTSNIASSGIGSVAGTANVAVSGKIFKLDGATSYVASGTDSLTKIIIDAQSALMDGSFIFDNTTTFNGLVTEYVGSSSVAAANFSSNLSGKYSYDATTPKRVFLDVQDAGTYSWDWTSVLDEQGVRDLLASTGSITGASFKMSSDVTVTGTQDNPIVINNHTLAYGSIIDGGGYRLTIEGVVNIASDATGILTSVNNGTIRNITLTVTANISHTASKFGIVAGENLSTGTITDVVVNGSGTISVTNTSGDVVVGGIVADNQTSLRNITSVFTIPNRLVASSPSGTATIGGIVGNNTGAIFDSTVSLTSEGSFKADTSSVGIVGGAVGTSMGSVKGVVVIADANAGGGILASRITSKAVVGGIAGTTSGSALGIDLSTISGGGTIGIVDSTASQGRIGGLVGEYATTLAGTKNIVEFKGSYSTDIDENFKAFVGSVFGAVTTTTASNMYVFYTSDLGDTTVGLDSTVVTIIQQKIDMEDVQIVGDTTGNRILVASNTPVMGIQEGAPAGVTYDNVTSSAVITPQDSNNAVYSWEWVTTYAGIVNYGDTIYYGSDYTVVTMPSYTDGWATDYGRIVAGYGVPTTATPIDTADKLLTWLSIEKVENADQTVSYISRGTGEGGTDQEWTRTQYEYAYLSGNIRIETQVFFNAQGILQEGRTLDGAGYTIISAKTWEWSGTGISAEIYDYDNDAALIQSLGLTGLGSTDKPIAVSSGLLAINHGTIKNVNYQVSVNQKVNDQSLGALNYNWIHGYICGINTGVIENVNVDIRAQARFHTNGTGSGATFLIGGITGYNYGGRISYASTNIASGADFNASPREGGMAMGGVVGLSNGGQLDHLKLSGSGTMRAVDLRKTGSTESDTASAPYMIGGIVGGMENSTTSVTLTGSANITITQTSLNYVYNGFTGKYVTSSTASSGQHILQGIVAGRVSSSASSSVNNPRINGITFLTNYNYYWAQPYTNANSTHSAYNDSNPTGYTYIDNLNHNSDYSKLTVFGGLATGSMDLFNGSGIYLDGVEGSVNGYFDYWTRLDTSNNGLAIEFEKAASLNTVTAQHKTLGTGSTSTFASGSASSDGVSNRYSYNADEYRVYIQDYYLCNAHYSGAFVALTIKPTYLAGTDTFYNFGSLEKSGRSITKSGTRITSSTTFPLTGDGDWYLDGDVTISSYSSEVYTDFTGKVFGNGYTLTFANTGYSATSPYGVNHTSRSGSYLQGIMFYRLTSDAKVYDLTINYNQHRKFVKNGGTPDDSTLYFGLLAGGISGSQVEVDNVNINMNGTLWVDSGDTWNNNFGVVIGLVGGQIQQGTLTNIRINHNGLIKGTGEAVKDSGWPSYNIWRPDMSISTFAGETSGSSRITITNTLFAGTGTLVTNGSSGVYSAVLAGYNNSSNLYVSNTILWGASYNMSTPASDLYTDNAGAPFVYENILVGNSRPTSLSGIYAVNGSTTGIVGDCSPTTINYKNPLNEGLSISYDEMKAGFDLPVQSVSVPNGVGTDSNAGPEVYMDGHAYIGSNNALVERYILRNKHRGMLLWSIEGFDSYYMTGTATSVYWTMGNDRTTYYGNFSLGQETKIFLVDGKGNIVSPDDILDGRRYDGSSDVTAVFEDIQEAVDAGLISQAEADLMLPGERLEFLKDKYQYSYQIFDITGTVALHHTMWMYGSTYFEEYVKPLKTSAEFVGSYNISAPTSKTFDGVSYYFFNSEVQTFSKSVHSSLSSVNKTYTISEALLVASPATSKTWAEETNINFYIPRGDDNAITRLVFYDDVQCTETTLPTKNITEYIRATGDSVGGYTYSLMTEQDRGGTIYYVGAYKLNTATQQYVRVASTAIVSTMIDQYAPVVGVNRGGVIDSNILPSDVTYVEGSDGTLEYGELKLYVQDVSMAIDSYEMYTTPASVGEGSMTVVTTAEYADGIIYTIRCYDSAVFNYTAIDVLGRSTTVKFTIDIVKPQLIINDQLSTYNRPGSSYDGVSFINNQEHRLYVSSISDNLTRTATIRDSLQWSITDSRDGSVVFSSTLNGQCYNQEEGYITLPLSGTSNQGVVLETAVLKVWVTDEVGNVTEVLSNGGDDIVIDTRNFIVRYGESLISKEGTISSSPTLLVTEGATGNSLYYDSNSDKYITLKRFDSFTVASANPGTTGFTYIGFGVDVNYVNVADRNLDYSEESLEIGVSTSQVVSLDGGTYSGVTMGATATEVKIVLFYTVALDLTMALPNTVDMGIAADGDVIDSNGIVIKRLVEKISRKINNVDRDSYVVNSSNFSSYINMVIYDENNVEYYNSINNTTNTHIPTNSENSYSITFTVKTDADFDKYYTINTSSAVYTLAVVNPSNPKVTFSLLGDTVNLKYNVEDTVYGGNWTDSSAEYGFRLKSLLRSAYDQGLLAFSLDGFVEDYASSNGADLFEDMKYTVLFRGAVYSQDYLVDVGTYNVTAQVKSNKGYTASYTFAVSINKTSVTFRPYEQQTIYGNAIASDAYYVNWSQVSIKDKTSYTWSNLSYELLDGETTLASVYYLGLNDIKIVVGQLDLSSSTVTIYDDKYSATVNTANKTLSIAYYKFVDGAVSEYPTTSTTQRRANTYTGYNGIIMTGGASNNYTLYFTGQYAPRLVISRRTITVKIINDVKYYNGDDPAEYRWELASGTFGYTDGVTDFTTNFVRTYPASGVDSVGDKYVITGTISNSNYNVYVIDGELSVEALKLNYFVSGTDNMYYDGTTDYFGTLEVLVTNAKKSDQVTAVIYYQIGYSEQGSSDPIYVDKDLNTLKSSHAGYVNKADRTFIGRLTTESTEPIGVHDIAWILPNTYYYKIVASSATLDAAVFKRNYNNYESNTISCDVTGYTLNVVILDQIIKYGSKINNTNTFGVTYKLEGVAAGDTVHLSALTIGLTDDQANFTVGKYVGVISARLADYTSSLGLKYVLNYVYGNLIVEKMEIGVNWSAATNSQVYNGTDQAATFTSGVTAVNSQFTDLLKFTYYNASGIAVPTIIDAGGYYIRASLPQEYADNYMIKQDSEYFYVNIDKAGITMKAFSNSAWNATTDTTTTTADYKSFTSGSLSSILSKTNITLHSASGGTITTPSKPAEYETWQFSVTNIGVSSTTHTFYGNAQNASALPTTALSAGTYEVQIFVPESANYYGTAQRVMFVVSPSGSSGTGVSSSGSRAATNHIVINKESTTVNSLNTVGIVTSSSSIPSAISTSASTITVTKVRRYQWIYFYFNIELSDEYFMLAQQGLLTLRLKGSVSSQRWQGTAFDWNESDSTSVIVRGIHDANDYRYGTSALGESSLSNSWNINNVYANMTDGWGSVYAANNAFCVSHQSAYQSSFNMQINASHAAYRVYLLMYLSPEEYDCINDSLNHGYLSSTFTGLSITAQVGSSQGDYTMETVDKSDEDKSTSNVFIPTTATSLFSVSAGNASWITVSGTKYYFVAPTGSETVPMYANQSMTQQMAGWKFSSITGYYKVQMRTNYNDNARAWRFTVGGGSVIGINPQTFEIKVKPTRGVAEVWSVANGKVHIVEISEHYNRIVFETSLLNDHQASLEELTVYDYKGNKKTLKEKVTLDNRAMTIGNVKTSQYVSTGFTAFSDTNWYKTAQYVTFDVQETEAAGFTGIDTNSVKLYYYDTNNVKQFVDLTVVSSETPSGSTEIVKANFRTISTITTSNVYYIVAKDKQGNEVLSTVNFHFDDTDDNDIAVTPDQNVTLDAWYDGDVTLRTEVGIDLANGLAISLGKLQYLASDVDMSGGAYLTSDAWRSMTLNYDETADKYYSTLTLTRSSVKYYMFRFETGAGNYIYTNLGLVKIDKIEPTIDVTVANTATDSLVISDKWEKGSVTFSISGAMGLSGGTLEYSSAGLNTSNWYEEGEGAQPATFTVTRMGDLYTATIVVTTTSYVESNYAIRFVGGNGKTVTVVFGNEKEEFTLKIDNIKPIVTTDVIAWQSKAQEALIDVTENESGIGNIVIEEKLKGTDTVVAFFTLDGAYVGSYADYTSTTAKYIDKIYDIVRISDAGDFRYVQNTNYEGRVFKYVGETKDGYAKDSYYYVGDATSGYAVTPYNGNGNLPEASNATEMSSLLTSANEGKYYRYVGGSTNEFSSNVIYKVTKDGESYRFFSAEEGTTRTITSQAGRYYFKFDDRDYTIYVYDAVGNMSTASYTPQVDSYEPTINVVAIQYASASDVNFTYHVVEDLSGESGASLITRYAAQLTQVFMHGEENAAYYVLTTEEEGNYFAYVFDESGAFVKLSLPKDSVSYKQSFTVSAATQGNEGLLSQLGIEEITFYPTDARLQVKAMGDNYGDGVAAEHVYDYATLDNTAWTTNTVKFIVTRWTAGASGGTLYTSNGVVSAISQWKLLKTVSSFSATETWRDYTNQNISYETSVEGATNYTFFYRSTSNIMVYYNFSSHKSETKNNTAEIAGKYAFMVKIDTNAPVIGKPEYLSTSGSFDPTIENKQDWWTTGDMEFRFTVEDGGDHRVTKSGIDESTILVTDADGNQIAWTYSDADSHYHFVINKTSVYTIQVKDGVGNYAERIITQYGGSAILVDNVTPQITATSNLASIQTNDNWATADVVFDITTVYGDSGATVVVERQLEDGAWVEYALENLVQDTTDLKKYTFTVSDQIHQSLTLRFAITSGANITRYSQEYTFRLDSVAPSVSYVAYLAGTNTVVDISGDQWHTDAVDIEFTVRDTGSGVNYSTIKCLKSGVEVALEAIGGKYVLRNVQDTAVYYLIVADVAGNVAGDPVNGQEYSWNIDAVNPTLSYTITSGGAPYQSGTWASSPVVVTFTVGFAVSSVERTGYVQYSTDGGVTFAQLDCEKTPAKEENGVFYYTFTYTYTNENNTYVYNAISRAGKVSDLTPSINIMVDADLPTIDATYLVDGAQWDFDALPWTTGDVTVNLTAQVGISGGEIIVLKGDTVVDTIPATQDVTAYQYVIAKNNSSDRYTFRVVKTMTGVSAETTAQLVQFDDVKPDVDVTSTYVMGTWSNQNVTLDVTIVMGASYKQTAFYVTQGTENESLLWKTVFNSADLSYVFVDKDGNSLDVEPTVSFVDGIATITFSYVISSAIDVNPVVQTSVAFRADVGNGMFALDTTFADLNSIRIDTFVPYITVGNIVKVDTAETYTFSGGSWSWSDGLAWSNKQVKMTFSLTYFESGGSLKYKESYVDSLGNTVVGSLINTSVIYGATTRGYVTVNGKQYNAYTVQCTLTVGTDKQASYTFVAESGAGNSSVGYVYDDNGTKVTETAEDFSISLNIDMTNPSITSLSYYRLEGGDYTASYNPERVAFVTDEKVKVTFDAADVKTNGIASGIASVKVIKNGADIAVTSEGATVYSFFVTDYVEYDIVVTDNAGRTSTRTVKIGVDSVKPTLAVEVLGGNDGAKGYATDLTVDYDALEWATEQLTFAFDGIGTTFGTSDGVILYSYDNVNWTTIGIKTTRLILSNKMTYGDRIYLKAQSNAGLSSDVVEIALKLDLREYSMTWLQKVGSYEGQYAMVSLSKYEPYKRGDVIEVSIDSYQGYTYNYRVVNGTETKQPLVGGKFVIVVEGDDVTLDIFFKESVSATYVNTTQYLKYKDGAYGALTTPVYVRNSHGDLLDLDVTYSIDVNGTVSQTTDVTLLGKSDTFPIGDYTVSVLLFDDSNYVLDASNNQKLQVRYFRQQGTQDDPYLIDNAVDFSYLNKTIYDSVDAHFAMVNDVILTAQISVGDFKGSLDGRNYKLTLSSPLQQLGLTTTPIFGELSGTVENLGIELGTTQVAVDGNYETESLYYGFLAEKLSGTIKNSYVVSDITFVEKEGGTLSGSLYIGGLVGLVTPSGKIDRVFTDAWLDVRGLTSASSIAVGGLVGSLSDLTASSIENTFSTATIYAGSGSIVAGMLAPTKDVNTLYGNKVVDDNVYVDGIWTGVLGNTTYYQLITPQELGNTQITMSNITGRGEPTFVLDLASARYEAAFDKAPTFANGNLCFEVSTAEEFAKINDFLWADYKQVADIELCDVVIALGSVYRGVYDGGGYTLTVSNTTAQYGLFDRVSGTIKNVSITTDEDGYQLDASANDGTVASLFVKELIGGTLDQIVIGGDFAFSTTASDKFSVGALVGSAVDATITDVVSTVYVSANGEMLELGAIVGNAHNTYIDNVYVVSTVNVNYTGSASIGAVAGVISGTTQATYYYDSENVYKNVATGTANYEGSVMTSLTVNGNIIDMSKFFVDDKGIVNYNEKEYAVIDGALYEAIGIVEMIDGSVYTVTIDGKKYDPSRITEDSTNKTVTVTGTAYAFRSNTYSNGETSERLVGLDNGTPSSLFDYTTLDAIMDVNSTAIIADGQYVRDSLYAMYSKEFEAGTGTAVDPFILSEKEDFKKISRYMYAHYKIRLKQGVTSLTFEEGEWETIGVGMNFTGSITADSYLDSLGYPRSVVLNGITDTFIDKNYGRISDFVLSVNVTKTTAEDTVFGVVSNENYGTISNMDVSGTVAVMIRGSYTLVAGGITGIYIPSTSTSSITSCSVNLTATFRAQTVVAGGAVGEAHGGTLTSLGLSSTVKVVSAEGQGTIGAYVGEAHGTVTIVRKDGNVDTASTVLMYNGVKLPDVESLLIGSQIG